jgi:hypothetical protein
MDDMDDDEADEHDSVEGNIWPFVSACVLFGLD